MPLFARPAVFMLAWRLMPRPDESRIPVPAPAASAASRPKFLTVFGEIEKLLAGVVVVDDGPDGHRQEGVLS